MVEKVACVLIHTLTEGNGMPLANCTTPANGSEREQIIPPLDKVKLKTLKPGRPRKTLKVLATDKGYDSKEKRAILRKARRGDTPHGRLYASVVFDLKYQNEFEKIAKIRADQSKLLCPYFNKSVALLGSNVNTVALRLDGSVRVSILTHS